MQSELVQTRIAGKLRALRAALRSRLALEGAAWLVLALVAAVFVTLGFDYVLRLERPLRAAIAAAAMIGAGAVLWRQVLLPLRVPMDAAALALLVERRFGQLGDRLVSAIQFEGRDCAALGVSPAMVARMAQEANALAGPLPFGQVVERRLLRRAWALAACALGLLLGFGFWQTDVLGRWFLRNVLFREIPWPQDTYLAVRGGPIFTVLRGDDLQVIVEAEPRSRIIPHHVTLHARYPSVGRTEERVEADGDNPGRFIKLFPSVAEEFEFHISGGDDRSHVKWGNRVRLIDPPGLRTVRFIVRHPSYMNRLKPEELDGARGVLAVPVGAEITVRAESNKDLASAEIVLDGKVVGAMRPETVQPDGREAPAVRQFVGGLKVAGENRPASHVLQFALRDTDGYTNRRSAKYVIQVQPDLAPTADLRKMRIGPRISPHAVIPLHVAARDDVGLASCAVTLRAGAAAGDPKLPPAASQPVSLPPDPGDECQADCELDILPLKLQPGETVQVGAQVVDTLPADFGGPNVGTSPVLSFTLVKPEDLLEELVRRQKEIRLEFMQALALQESARARTESVRLTAASAGLTPEVRRLLAASAGLQGNVGAEVAKAADALQAVVDEMRSNRLATDTEREQIREGVVQPLRALSGPIGKLVGALNGARQIDSAEELQTQAVAIEDVQKDIFRQMEEILQRMTKLEGKQELASKLQLIIKWSEQLLDVIRTKQQAEVGKVFQPTTEPASMPTE